MNSITCPKCKASVHFSRRSCQICETPMRFPNVVYAEKSEEVDALEERYRRAKVSAEARNVSREVVIFEALVNSESKAVMNRDIGTLMSWLNIQSPFFRNFHWQVKNAGRQPADTHWDEQRASAENAINPIYYEHINYAALTLDMTGMSYYGEYSVILNDFLIEDRATVFEKNCFVFNLEHAIIAGTSPPHGYRTVWHMRGKLAVAKLQPKIFPGQATFEDIIIEPRRGEPNCDFIEVHVYGKVHYGAIDRIAGPPPALKADRLLWKQLKRKAIELQIRVEERV